MSTNNVNSGEGALMAMMEVVAESSTTGQKDQLMLGKTYATAQFLNQLSSTLERIGNSVTIQSFLKAYLADNKGGATPLSPVMLALTKYSLSTATADNVVIDGLNQDISDLAKKLKDYQAAHNYSTAYFMRHAPWYVWLGGPIVVASYAGAKYIEEQKKVGSYSAKEAVQVQKDDHKLQPAEQAATLDMNRISSDMSIQGQKGTSLTEAQIKLDGHEVDASINIISAYSNICGSNNPDAPKYNYN